MPGAMASPRARHAAAGALAAVAAWLIFYAGWLLLAPADEHVRLVFADTAYLVPIAAASAPVRAGRRCAFRRVSAASGFSFAVACASWLAGEVLWSVAELTDRVVPLPWWTDVCYYGFYGAVLIALVSFFRPSLRLIGGQGLLDGLLAVSALALLWWWLVLRDLTLGSDGASLVGLSYPVLDLVLICTIAATPLVSARRGTLAGWLVAAGVAAGGIADGIYTHLVVARQLRLRRAHRPRLAGPGLPDLRWRRSRLLSAIGRKPIGPSAARRCRIRTAASMTAALVVVLAVSWSRACSGDAVPADSVVFVFAVAALLRLAAGCCCSRPPGSRRGAIRSPASTTSRTCTTSFGGSPRPLASTTSRSRSC